MPRYQFYVVTGGEVEGSVDAEFADEDSALSAARAGLAKGQEIEVWSGLQWVGLVEDRSAGVVIDGLSWPAERGDEAALPCAWERETRD